MTTMNPFEGLQDGKLGERGNYFANGTYKLQFQRAVLKDAREVGLAFITEWLVLESNNPKHMPGSVGTIFEKMARKEVAMNNIYAMIYALLGYNSSPEAQEHFKANIVPRIQELAMSCVHNAAVFGGKTLELNVKTAISKKNGNSYGLNTYRAWQPPPGWQPMPTPAAPAEDQARPMNARGVPQGYGAPPPAYGAPQGYPPAPYGAPPMGVPPGYGAPPPAAPPQGYPPPGYGAPPAPYGAPGMPPAGAPAAPPGPPPGPPGYPPPGVPTGWPPPGQAR